MSLITDSIPSLLNGVSQQSPLVRSKDQLEDMVNGWSSLASGLAKRPGTEHVAKIAVSDTTNAMIHEINRDASERYIVVAHGGTIQVFDMNGVEQTVNAPGGWSYLSDITDYTSDLAMFTVADYTFVVNRKRTVAMMPLGSDLQQQPDYLAWLNRTTSTDGLGQVYAPGVPYQYAPNHAATLTGTVASFEKLPTTPSNGALYAVTGDSSNYFTTYYVEYQSGAWNETLKPGLINSIDPATMPHCLVRKSDGTFGFIPFSWMPRRIGDTNTNPDPVFIGRTIRKVFFYQNRLALLSDESAIMSVAGDFGNFYRTTVLDLLDSDPISVAATSTKVSILYDAVPFNDGILLTSDQTQFSMTNGELGITAQSMAIKPVTNYEVSVRAGLSAINTDVYFAVERNGFAGIREYSRVANADTTSAADITAHIPSYIPAGVKKIIPAGDINALFVLTDGAPSRVYPYQFYWASSDSKIQSAWHYWDFGTGSTVLSGTYISGYLYLIIKRDGEVFIERVNMQPDIVQSNMPIRVYLDRQVMVSGTYNSSTDTTDYVLPYAPDKTTFRFVRSNADTGRPGSLVDPSGYVWTDLKKLTVPGNETAGQLMAGTGYTLKITFSRVYARRSDGTAITTGRLQLRTFTVSYKDTGYFHTIVNPYGELAPASELDVIPSKVKDFTGKIVGAADLILNKPVAHTGQFPFQVFGDASQATITITNDSHVGSTFLAAEWEAFYFNRAR